MSSDFSHDTTFGSPKREYISLYPKKELNFTLHHGIYVAKLALANTNPQSILYKIKLTAAKFYHVHPTAGKLLPGEKIIINIKMPYPEEPEERFDDRFLVQAFPHDDPYLFDNVQEVMEAFKDHFPTAGSIQQTKLKVYFELPRQIQRSGQRLKSPISQKSSSKQVTWKNELEVKDEKEEVLNGVRTASTNNSLKNEEEVRSPAYSLNNLNNNNSRDNSLHIFTPQKQTEHQRKDSDLNNNSAGSITFRRINLKSGGAKKKSIEEEIKASMSRGNQRTDMTEALLSPAKIRSSTTETRKNVMILDDNNHTKNISMAEISQGGISDVSTTTAARRNLILKQKFFQLENKYKTQKTELEEILAEKEEYINQFNKLKHIFSDFLSEPQEVETISCNGKKLSGMRFEAWQLMIVSVIFLILGSIIAS